jgi:hypothetical protein
MEPVQFCTKDHNLKMLTNPILTNKSETAHQRLDFNLATFHKKHPQYFIRL